MAGLWMGCGARRRGALCAVPTGVTDPWVSRVAALVGARRSACAFFGWAFPCCAHCHSVTATRLSCCVLLSGAAVAFNTWWRGVPLSVGLFSPRPR